MPCESLDLGFVFQNFLERVEEDMKWLEGIQSENSGDSHSIK